MRRGPSRLSATASLAIGCVLMLSACSMLLSSPPVVEHSPATEEAPEISSKAQDVVVFALGLVETGYRFGGKNPDAGLDCSGMVSYVFDKAANVKLPGSAADIAKQGRRIDMASLRPGDLVFFNTRHKPYSHVGIYIGDGRFVHAPSSAGKVRAESLKSGWFAARFEEARSYLE